MVLILLISLAVPAGAAGTPTLSISSGEVKAGESVTLTVSIKDNPGIAASLLYIYFDTTSFSVDVDEDISASGKFSSGAMMANSIKSAKENGRYDGDLSKDGIVVLWYGSKNVASDGNILKVKLKANKDIANGDHAIIVEASKTDTCDVNGKDVLIAGAESTISASGGSNSKKPETFLDVPEFSDISGNWAEKYIVNSAELGLVEGYQGLYRPNDTMTRAEFVTILWRAMGEPKPKGKASFTDLKQDWYFESVAWAEENNVINGMGDGLFAPTGSVTREQLVTILHRLAGTPLGGELLVSSVYDGKFSDSDQISTWAKQAMYWSIYEGIYCGEQSEEIGTMLAPRKNANRAQIAVMMIRYLEE